jgi:hypothetical protein
MATEKLQLNTQQYRTLLKLLYCGDWLINANRDEPLPEFRDLEQYIHSFAGYFGCDDLVEWSDEFKQSFPTKKLDDEMADLIHDYDEDCFWEELVFRMARRDCLRKYGKERLAEMDWEELFKLEAPFIHDYEEEFSKFGIERLFVLADENMPRA